MRVTRQYSTRGENVWRVVCVPSNEKRRTHFPQPLCQRTHARKSELDRDTAPEPVIQSGPFATSLVRVPLSGVSGSVGPDLVDSI